MGFAPKPSIAGHHVYLELGEDGTERIFEVFAVHQSGDGRADIDTTMIPSLGLW
jgi:hypothetical protein